MFCSLLPIARNSYGMDINPNASHTHLMATGGEDSEVFIWDLNNVTRDKVREAVIFVCLCGRVTMRCNAGDSTTDGHCVQK